MAKEYYCYPREGFVPKTRALSDGTLLAHAGDTPIWMSHDLCVYALDGEQFVQLKVNTSRNRNYGQLSPGGFRSGHTYPRVDYKGKTYYVHRLMAIAWIGAIPEGWQVDHINGDIYNWSRDNIRIVTVAENVRCAKYLRVLRQVCPLHAQTFQREDYLRWFYMPFEEFKASLTSGLGELVGPEQMMKESFYDRD